MHISRRRLLYGSAGVAAVSVAGCAAGEETANLTGFTGLAMPTTASERWIADGESLKTQLEAKGYEVLLEYGEDVVDDQIAQIQTMIDAGVEFLIIAAIDNSSLGAVLAKAKDQGITIIAYDRLIRDTPDVDYYASFDNYQVGVLQGRHIVDQLDLDNSSGPFNVELFSGSPDDSNSQYFFQGGLDTLERYTYEGTVQILSKETELEQTSTERWDGEIAEKRMEGLLEDYYEDEPIHAVLSPYDGISRGIVRALEAAGYTPGSADFPVVTGQDAEPDSVKAIRDETGQTQTVFKDTRDLAGIAVSMVENIMNGRTPEVNDLGTYDNGFKFVPSFLLEPVSVDEANWEEVLIGSEYYSEDDLA